MSVTSELDKYVDGSSILLWEINLLKQSLHVAMQAGWDEFPHDAAKIMKNPGYRQEVVKGEDLEGLNSALANIRKGKSCKVVFRILSCDNLTHWCLLAGNAEDSTPDTIYGSLICVEDHLISQADYGHPQNHESHPVSADAGLPGRRMEALKRRLGRTDDLYERLQAICDWEQDGVFETVLFSDVKLREGRVEVHKAGALFKTLPQGKSFPYEGTIAEMIVSLNLSYIVVDDAMESLKPIDWALFVPHGIRSYFAVPFFENRVIRGVLIFCSADANGFSDDQEMYFKSISEAFFAQSEPDSAVA